VEALDIHDYNGKLTAALRYIKNSKISPQNKKIIENFHQQCLLENLSVPRIVKLVETLVLIAKQLKVGFDKAKIENLKNFIAKVQYREDYSEWTKQSYRVILKKFYKWMVYKDEYKLRHEYPPICAWICTNISRKNQPKVKASDILTEDEIDRLIKSAEHPRDKAFISMLYELGSRIGEIGGMRVRDVTRDQYSYIVDLEGKTGHRTPRIVLSDPYLTTWLNIHPYKDNPDAPLWLAIIGDKVVEPMMYQALRKLVKRLAAKAKIKKRIYPHLFRHTRVTHLLLNKQLNETQAKVYFGWTPSSKMIAEYSHMLSSDVNETILNIHGIKTEEMKESKLKPKQCPKCSAINTKDSKFCCKCSGILDLKTAVEMDQMREKSDEMLMALIKEKGMLSALKDNEVSPQMLKKAIMLVKMIS